VEGQAYSYTFTATGNPAPTFTVSSGSLPTGLSLAAATGVLSGTPSVTGTFTFVVQASNGVSPAASTPTLSIAVSAPVPNNFSISANPTSLSLVQNTSGTSTISTSVTSGSAQSVSFSIVGVPSGANASFSPGSVTAGSSSTLAVGAGNAVTGTYSLTITGTGSSATHSTSLTLTIMAPPPPPPFPIAAGTIFAQDTFAGRTVAGGWGTASDGNIWTLTGGSGSSESVSGNQGHVLGSGSMSTLVATLGTSTAADTEVVDRLTSNDYANDAGQVIFRASSSSTYYAAGLDSPVSGAEINVFRVSGATKSRVANVAFAATNGTAYWQRARITTSGGSVTIMVRVWQDGTVEPSTWNLAYTDNSPLPAGMAGARSWDGGLGWAIDHFSAGKLS